MDFNNLDERQKARAETYKAGINVEASRRKREEVTVSLRKADKREQLKKRRQVATLDSHEEAAVVAASGFRVNVPMGACRVENLPMMMDKLRSGDTGCQVEATTLFRKLLSIEKTPPIDEVIAAGAVPIFVAFLKRGDCSQLQFEAAWALTNIASGQTHQTRCVIENQAVPGLIALLNTAREDVREQAIWCLGNISGDSTQCRDYILSNRIMTPLLQNLASPSNLSITRNATWTLSNLCRGKPQPDWSLVSPALQVLNRVIYSNDEEVLTDALWALSYLSDGSDTRIQEVLEAGIVRRVVELLGNPSAAVVVPALRTIGNIVTGNDVQTQAVMNCNVLPALLALLQSPKENVRKEACWTVSNITAGNRHQIKAVIDANLIPALIEIMDTAEFFKTKKEAAWAVCNLTSGGTADNIRYIASVGAVKALCDLFEVGDQRIVTVALEGVENILKVGALDAKHSGVNHYAGLVDEAGGLDVLVKLQEHENQDIYKKAMKILQEYFDASEEEDQTLIPVPAQNGFGFGFGAPAVPVGGYGF